MSREPLGTAMLPYGLVAVPMSIPARMMTLVDAGSEMGVPSAGGLKLASDQARWPLSRCGQAVAAVGLSPIRMVMGG